jgi:diguanylate cyclase (GGDEF)-like protein
VANDSTPLPAHSQASQLLRQGFRGLKFPEPLESQFRLDHRNEAHRLVRLGLLVALITTLGFAFIDHSMLQSTNRAPDAIRFGLQLPMLFICLLATGRRFYLRFYELAIQIGLPIFGLGSVLMASYANPESVALVGARLLLVAFFAYFMTGLRLYQALRCNIIVFAALLWVGVAGMIPSAVATYLGFAFLCANIIGGTGAYALERVNRTSFIERLTLEELASRDGLTQLLNRQTFEARAQASWPRAAAAQRNAAVLMIDVDHFKRYNDHYGHQAGDECLRRVAQALRTTLAARHDDLLGRYGGEEFIALLFDRSQEELEGLAHRIAKSIAAQAIPHAASDAHSLVTVSVGAARHIDPLPQAYNAVAQIADKALYVAKHQGRNRAVILEAHLHPQLAEHNSHSSDAATTRPEARPLAAGGALSI